MGECLGAEDIDSAISFAGLSLRTVRTKNASATLQSILRRKSLRIGSAQHRRLDQPAQLTATKSARIIEFQFVYIRPLRSGAEQSRLPFLPRLGRQKTWKTGPSLIPVEKAVEYDLPAIKKVARSVCVPLLSNQPVQSAAPLRTTQKSARVDRSRRAEIGGRQAISSTLLNGVRENVPELIWSDRGSPDPQPCSCVEPDGGSEWGAWRPPISARESDPPEPTFGPFGMALRLNC